MRRAHLIFFPITGDKLTIDHAILEKYIIIIIIIIIISIIIIIIFNALEDYLNQLDTR